MADAAEPARRLLRHRREMFEKGIESVDKRLDEKRDELEGLYAEREGYVTARDSITTALRLLG